jgi:hypothetical protein
MLDLLARHPTPGGWFPTINRIALGGAPNREDWTLHFFDVSADGKSFKFRLRGSVTGPDGEGAANQDFVSNSKRISFLASDITCATTARVLKKQLPAEFDITWRTTCMSADDYRPRSAKAKPSLDVSTLVNGVSNERHKLTIAPDGKGPLVIRELIVHCPEF